MGVALVSVGFSSVMLEFVIMWWVVIDRISTDHRSSSKVHKWGWHRVHACAWCLWMWCELIVWSVHYIRVQINGVCIVDVLRHVVWEACAQLWAWKRALSWFEWIHWLASVLMHVGFRKVTVTVCHVNIDVMCHLPCVDHRLFLKWPHVCWCHSPFE